MLGRGSRGAAKVGAPPPLTTALVVLLAAAAAAIEPSGDDGAEGGPGPECGGGSASSCCPAAIITSAANDTVGVCPGEAGTWLGMSDDGSEHTVVTPRPPTQRSLPADPPPPSLVVESRWEGRAQLGAQGPRVGGDDDDDEGGLRSLHLSWSDATGVLLYVEMAPAECASQR
jgi:hypothetical protein